MTSPSCLLLEPGNQFGRTKRFHLDFVFGVHMPILFFLQLNYRRPIFLSKWEWGEANTNSVRAPIKVPGRPCVVLLTGLGLEATQPVWALHSPRGPSSRAGGGRIDSEVHGFPVHNQAAAAR